MPEDEKKGNQEGEPEGEKKAGEGGPGEGAGEGEGKPNGAPAAPAALTQEDLRAVNAKLEEISRLAAANAPRADIETQYQQLEEETGLSRKALDFISNAVHQSV